MDPAPVSLRQDQASGQGEAAQDAESFGAKTRKCRRCEIFADFVLRSERRGGDRIAGTPGCSRQPLMDNPPKQVAFNDNYS